MFFLIVEEYNCYIKRDKKWYCFVDIENGFIPDEYRHMSEEEVSAIINNSVVKIVPAANLILTQKTNIFLNKSK